GAPVSLTMPLINKVYEFKDGVVKEFIGDIEAFFEERRLQDFRDVELSQQAVTESTPKNTISSEQKTVNTSDKKIKNQISKLEQEIEDKETQINVLELKIAELSAEGKYEEQIVKQLGENKSQLNKLMEDWEKLSEQV
ncbi:MAG TPA: ABC transporter C-terminal domain-containing protein, partial [Chitinophagales bacterium]|nr:ABC transporter C-terminal domain-containing protein [Chitinophagales bacterium]